MHPTLNNLVLRSDEVIYYERIIAKTNYPSEMSTQSSEFVTRNFYAFLELLGQDILEDGVNLEDQILRDSMISYRGEIMYPPPPRPKEVSISKAPPEVVDGEGNTIVSTSPRDPDYSDTLPETVVTVIKWINEHKEELAMGKYLVIISFKSIILIYYYNIF